jgi:hypothetical protein
METVRYQWKMRSLAKGLDPEQVISELETVENLYGQLTAENIVNYASKGECLLAQLFEWDDGKAAHQYRLQQARTVLNNIEVKILSDGHEKELPAYEVVQKGNGQQYKNVADLDEDDLKQVKAAARQQIASAKQKLAAYSEFDNVIKNLNQVLDHL